MNGKIKATASYISIRSPVLYLLFYVLLISFTPPARGHLTIRFKNYVGDKPLAFDSVSYKNALGQSYTVSMFKYYAGNFHLKNRVGEEYISKGYFLMNQEDTNSLSITIDDIPYGEYTSVSFTLGVDSVDNCSGAQSGALDPVNGMFWAWNSGYIFLKMEGISTASNSTGNRLEFHIGGYKEPNNCIKEIHLELQQSVKLEDNQHSTLTLKADINQLFSGPTPIDFSKISSVTDFHNATKIADNYYSMFTVLYPSAALISK